MLAAQSGGPCKIRVVPLKWIHLSKHVFVCIHAHVPKAPIRFLWQSHTHRKTLLERRQARQVSTGRAVTLHPDWFRETLKMFSRVRLLKEDREKQGNLPFIEIGSAGLNELWVAAFTTPLLRALLMLLVNDPRENKCSLLGSFHHCIYNSGIWRSHKPPSKLMSCLVQLWFPPDRSSISERGQSLVRWNK